MSKWRLLIRSDIVNYSKQGKRLTLYCAPKILYDVLPRRGKAFIVAVSEGGKSIRIWLTLDEMRILKRDIEQFLGLHRRRLERDGIAGFRSLFGGEDETNTVQKQGG